MMMSKQVKIIPSYTFFNNLLEESASFDRLVQTRWRKLAHFSTAIFHRLSNFGVSPAVRDFTSPDYQLSQSMGICNRVYNFFMKL